MRTFNPHDSDGLVLSDIRELLYLLVVEAKDDGSRSGLVTEFKYRRMVNDAASPGGVA